MTPSQALLTLWSHSENLGNVHFLTCNKGLGERHSTEINGQGGERVRVWGTLTDLRATFLVQFFCCFVFLFQ